MAQGSGALRHRITIKEKVSTIDDRGFAEESWTPVCTVWAAAENLRGREYFAAAAVQAEHTVRFTLRYRSGLDTTMRIVFGDSEYTITHIDPVEYRKTFLEILAVEVDRGGS